MIKKWKSMYLILSAIMRSGPGLVNFATLLILFMVVYALCGMQLFAGQLDPGLRSNFDNLGFALLTVFQVVSGENWNDVLYGTMEVGNPIQGAIFTVTMYMIGNYIILNIFVAILLDNFEKVSCQPKSKVVGRARCQPKVNIGFHPVIRFMIPA